MKPAPLKHSHVLTKPILPASYDSFIETREYFWYFYSSQKKLLTLLQAKQRHLAESEWVFEKCPVVKTATK
jgi:hypothetical protein